WFGQGDAPTKDLVRLYDSLDTRSLREHFAFVVSQRRDNEAIDKLIDLARTDRDAEVRKQAMFWLGQTKDPRAIKFFHDVLVP
ncbi:MAG TPA: HEAT repeat domain-containing protein, partial [Gemmatimonadaceae bacterium]|nr:HEAT repeat domain-containing protein [Gemmatimonadaceae bacterium]